VERFLAKRREAVAQCVADDGGLSEERGEMKVEFLVTLRAKADGVDVSSSKGVTPDAERGVRLVCFALHWIKAELHEYILRNWRLVKVATTKAQRKLFFNLRSLKKGLAPISAAQVSDVAQALNVRPEDVVEMETRLAGREMAFEGEDDEDSYAPVNYLADPGAEPSEQLEAAEGERVRTEGIARALAALDPRSRRIVEARWLREKDPATLHDLADEFGVSAERIRQIESKALEKMRKAIAAGEAPLKLSAPAAA